MLTIGNEDVFLSTLHFDGIARYLERPLNSHPGTFEWLFDPGLCRHKCGRVSPQESLDPGNRIRHDARKCRQIEREMRKHCDKLQRWLRSSDDIFWVYGKAGSGKSTLMKFLFEHKRTRVHLSEWAHGNDVTIAASFFWNAGSELEKSYIGLLRALLYQVLSQHPDLIQVIFPERWSALLRSSTQRNPWTEKELFGALQLLSQAPTANLRLFFLIDGLDEFSGDCDDLNTSLRELNKSTAIKICVSSRPWTVFRSAYGDHVRCRMELHELTTRDVDIYIADRLECLQHSSVLTQNELKTLGNEVRIRAEGVFLWVRLAVRDLRRGISKRDSIRMLQRRLAHYPSELHDFYQHILDKIDPVYSKFTGRLLLTMVSSKRPPDLICLPLWEEYSSDNEILGDTQWLPKSVLEMHQLLDRGMSCVENWVSDLVDPIDPIQAHLRCTYSPDMRHFFGSACPSFSHRTIYQFVQQKADDGTLARMAGPEFDPLLASQHLLFGISRYSKDLEDFAQLIDSDWGHIIIDLSCAEDRFGNIKPQSITQIVKIILAFDSLGQYIPRLQRWDHWTSVRLDKYSKDNNRAPLNYQHSTFMAYLLNEHAGLDAIVETALEQHPESFTPEQRRFLLESALIPCLYHLLGYSGPHWPRKTVVKIIESGIDVNQPIRRINCSFDYSIWQIFLLWIHGYMCQYQNHELPDGIVVQHFLDVFRTFLTFGADPCAIVSAKDLSKSCDRYDHTLRQRADLLSATEVLEDIRRFISYSAIYGETIHATIDGAQALLAEILPDSNGHLLAQAIFPIPSRSQTRRTLPRRPSTELMRVPVFDMYLDRSRGPIGRSPQSLISFLQRKSMRDQGLQIQNSVGEKTHRRGPGVMIPVDELQVDLDMSLSVVR